MSRIRTQCRKFVLRSCSLLLLELVGCGRKESPTQRPDDVDPTLDALIADVALADASALDGDTGFGGLRTCRDGFLFDLSGSPMEASGFAALTPIAPNTEEADDPRIALTGTMGTIDGSLKTDDVERVTCKMVGALRSCFQTELKTKPQLHGSLSLEIDIALNGKVMLTRRKGGTIAGEFLLGCISNAFVHAQYPMPKAKTTFRYQLLAKTHASLSPRSVQMVESGVGFTGEGTLETEILKRIVRASFPRFRACYELGIDLDPLLHGNVTAVFLVDDTGAVTKLHLGPTTIPDKVVSACVLGVFATMTFPEPVAGNVEVAIPLAFANVP